MTTTDDDVNPTEMSRYAMKQQQLLQLLPQQLRQQQMMMMTTTTVMNEGAKGMPLT
jgi:hypothetical protein